jgi:hypothetical protein
MENNMSMEKKQKVTKNLQPLDQKSATLPIVPTGLQHLCVWFFLRVLMASLEKK